MSGLGNCLGILGDPGGRVLAGVSGGVDSMALLYFLKEEGFGEVVVCHLNHGLRGEEADGDEEFVRGVAGELGYGFESGRVDVRGMMAEGGSLETVAREARHEFFGRCAGKFDCGRLLLAHHADDQAETVLWNLMRGSFGCRGMREVQSMGMGGVEMEVLRPFLKTRKEELRGWMERRGFAWREDASNEENDVVRNRIRNEVFPLLEGIAGRDVRPMFSRAVEVDEGWRELLDWVAGRADVLDPRGRIHLGVFRELPEVVRGKVMVDFLGDAGVSGMSRRLIAECVALVDIGAGPSVNLPGGRRLRRRQGRIFVEEI